MRSLHSLAPIFRLLSASLILINAQALHYKGVSDPIKAQQSPVAHQERQIENTVPKHVPLQIKIRKEKEHAWKDLKNENWAEDFELEIKNTGEKPIYTLYLNIFFDVPTEFDTESATGIYYGRPEISDPNIKPTEDDVPIKPGESKVFRIHQGVVRAWEIGRREKGRRLPTRVRIDFYQVTFGDGTGLMFDKAVPHPRKTSQSSKSGTLPQTGRRREKWRSTPTIALGFSALNHGEAAPQRSQQSLLIERHGNEPLELIDVKIGDLSVKSKIKSKWRSGDDGYDEATFDATEEWPKDIRLRVRNISGKQLTGFQAYIYLKPPASQLMFGVDLKGPGTTRLEHTALAPGQEIDAEVDGDSWERAIIRLAQYGGELVKAEVRLSIGLVGFPEGLYWRNGRMIRLDPNNPNRYIPVETKRP